MQPLRPAHRPPLPPRRDPNFGPIGGRPSRLSPSSPLHLDPEADLRVIASPLGWLGLVVWLGLMSWTDWPLVWTLPLGLGIPLLFRYYCWDCGQSGFLWRWTKHTCPTVQRLRARGGQPRPWWWLAPNLQAWVWLYVILAILVFVFA